jgi:glycosyltransferase involved in cell wall biosynthesis
MTRSVAIIGTRGYPSYYGGFETAVRKLAPFLVNSSWDVTVYGRPGSTASGDPDLDPRVISKITKGIETKSLSTLSFGFTACLDAAIRKPDVAIVMNVANGFWLPFLWARGIPTLVNVDGIEWDRAKWGRAAKWVFRMGARATARFGSRLVYDAMEISKRWDADFKRDGVFIPYGGDVPLQLPVEEGLRHRNYVLVVARFVPENTVGEFLEAAAGLSKNWDVVIVGSSGYGGELDDQAAKLARDNPRVQWLGHLSDDARLLSLWQHAGAYFHGHSVGGTNPALVQAMACGAPTVARDTIYNREVLGSAGIFTAPDPTSIQAAIDRLMSSPEEQELESHRALDRARLHYSWQDVCERYETSISLLAASKRSQR